MAEFCVMVSGPCRGKMCDFWARIRLRKALLDELVQGLREGISSCEEDVGSDLEDAFSQYWYDFGIKNLRRLCEEEPDLCSKMKQAEEQIRMLLL